ncbi:MAG: class I SAM-dependent methyltransferase [bacterium]|nr:class I SAM-dependent methyltransferase [bacterium]
MNQKNGWQLKESGPEAYEKYIVPAFAGGWAQGLIERAGLKPGERVLDAACGTGIVARNAAAAVGTAGKVTGVDVNEVVLEKARQLGGAGGIEWLCGSAVDLPVPDGEYDAVLCQQGLQYFPDRDRALKEMFRALVPGGRVLLSVWRSMEYFPFYMALRKALEQYISPGAAAGLESAFVMKEPGMLKELLRKAGFADIMVHLDIRQMRYPNPEEFITGGMAASPFAPDYFALDEKVQKEMLRTICESLTGYIDDEGLAAPMEAYVVRAVK